MMLAGFRPRISLRMLLVVVAIAGPGVSFIYSRYLRPRYPQQCKSWTIGDAPLPFWSLCTVARRDRWSERVLFVLVTPNSTYPDYGSPFKRRQPTADGISVRDGSIFLNGTEYI